MAVLVVAEHDNASVKDATNKVITAAKAMGGAVDVLVAGSNAGAAAAAAAKIDGVRKVLHADGATLGKQMAEPLEALIVPLAADSAPPLRRSGHAGRWDRNDPRTGLSGTTAASGT